MNRELFTLPQAAEILGIDRSTLFRWVKADLVEVLKINERRWLITREELDRVNNVIADVSRWKAREVLRKDAEVLA